MNSIIDIVSRESNISKNQVKATIELLEKGATIPFISRYRKELTGQLDEIQIGLINELNQKYIELKKRKEYIIKTIDEQGQLTEALKLQINNTQDPNTLEDLYLPYKKKKLTRATIAKNKGLEPLATFIFKSQFDNYKPKAQAAINKDKDVNNLEDALHGASDIIAEWVSEHPSTRETLRKLFEKSATINSKVVKSKKEQAEKYRDYFEWNEPMNKIPSHRLLALRRGEKEGFLRLNICPEEDEAILKIFNIHLKNPKNDFLKNSFIDSYKRLLKPSLETESRYNSKTKADIEAIEVFADNIKELLLAAPLGQKTILALDPGFRTGCKVVVLDKQGKLLYNSAIYPNEPQKRVREAEIEIAELISKYKIEAIAIGNGTASRETEAFVKKLKPDCPVIMVNESGASIYSASEVARNEFPDHDVTVRGSVSIGRRLADPLAELVKIEPKSIGVGQYQHDVDQSLLKKKLTTVVESCVNKVGVELNTASKELLTYVSGIGDTIAQNIVNHRKENGPFKNRKDLLEVPRMGAKAYEQAAGFLRIKGAKNPLDSSSVHPERYQLVKTITKDLSLNIEELIGNSKVLEGLNLDSYVDDKIGLPTLKDIVEELKKPGRDPRSEFELFEFATGVESMEDLHIDMLLPGIVTNVTKFGAFVDIGVHQDGLVHISQLSNTYVSDPAQVVKVNQKVKVKVLEVDVNRKRISLSMKTQEVPKPIKTKAPRPSNNNDFNDQLSKLKGKWN